jgi:polysaccharide export outer membrane protein
VQTLDLTRLASATIPTDLIARGDVISIEIAAGLKRDETSEFKARVADDGTVNVVHVGDVHVEGLSLTEAETAVLQACVDRELYRSPHITVTMVRPKVNRVTVLGAVKEPTTVELRSGSSDLLQAIVQAGGLTEDAGTMVEVRHPGYREDSFDDPAIADDPGDGPRLASLDRPVRATPASSIRVDLASLGTADPKTYELQDGSVVMVEKRDPPALQVLGLVQRPNQYDFPVGKNMRLLDAVSLAGGVSNTLADKVFIIRRREGHEPLLVEASLHKAKRHGQDNLLLEPGDTVSIEQTPGTVFMDMIRVVGVTLGGSLF